MMLMFIKIECRDVSKFENFAASLGKMVLFQLRLKEICLWETQQCVFICRKHWYVSTGLLPFYLTKKIFSLLSFVFTLFLSLPFKNYKHKKSLTLKNRNILIWHIIINHSVCYLFGNVLETWEISKNALTRTSRECLRL